MYVPQTNMYMYNCINKVTIHVHVHVPHIETVLAKRLENTELHNIHV